MSEETGWRSAPKDFREALRSPERRPAGDVPEIYEFGPFRLEPAERKLLRGNEVVALTPKAFDTLHLLVRNSDHLLNKDELIRVLWPDSFVEEGNLTTNISLLRKTLGHDPEYIETVPKIGYRFIGAVRRLPTAERARPENSLAAEGGSADRGSSARHPPGLSRLLTPSSAVSDSRTPDRGGDLVQESASPLTSRSSSRRTVLIITACAIAIVGAAYIALSRLSHRGVAATAGQTTVPLAEKKSIAVLPFIDLSEEHDQEYFADGMAEEIINFLGRIPGLKAISRTSSFRFKGKNQDVRAVGSTLGVSYLVEGSVRRSGERLRVTAQLISVQDGSHLWSDAYDARVGDALSVQDQIASNLVRALQISVGAADYRLERSSFKSTEAYDLYLRGLHALDRSDTEGMQSAEGYFQQVLELDPTSVPAADLLVLTQAWIAIWGYVEEPAKAFERARVSAQRALALDPKSSMAYVALSIVHNHDWDWAAAERDAREAVRLMPRDPIAIGQLADVCRTLGRWGESARLYETASSLDPLDATWHARLFTMAYVTGRLREAEAEMRKVLQITPSYDGGHVALGTVLLAQRKPEAALAEMQQEPAPFRKLYSAVVLHAMGRREEADAALAEYIREHAQDDAFNIAQAYGYRGELDQAFTWLDQAYRQKDPQLWNIKLFQLDPLMRDLGHDPRYVDFLRKMHLPE